jgi:hypothetical protein
MSVSGATYAASAKDGEMLVTLKEVSVVDNNTSDDASNNDKETEEDMFFGPQGNHEPDDQKIRHGQSICFGPSNS